MRTFDPILFDTNILIYNQVVESQFYPQASKYHQKVFDEEIRAVVSSQNLLEFSAVMINPKKIIKPLSRKSVAVEVEKYIESEYFDIVYPNKETLPIFNNLLKKYHLSNPRRTFDLFLVATMLSNGIKTILTANDKDFGFKEIKVIGLV